MVAPGGIEPPTRGFSVLCSTDWATKPNIKKWRSRRELNSRSSAWQADVITATPRDHGCGGWIWTNDLWVMSPTSYQAAPLRDINYKTNGGERGIRTPAPLPTSRFSRPVPSTRLGYFSTKNYWCLRPDLNRHGIWLPQDFKSCASTNFATQAQINGVPWRTRIADPLIKSQMLYLLS